MSAYGRTDLEQSIVNARKVARSAVRLKYSIAADNELNEVMPILERRLADMLQQGRVPAMSTGDIEAIINSEPVHE